jgi:RNase P/RNase MRP subunit POP5
MKPTKKLKLKNSQRDNRRYLLVQGNDNEKIENAILDYVGILGFAKSSYIKVKSEDGKIICAVKREEIEKVKASLALAGIKVLRISGTLKGLGR